MAVVSGEGILAVRPFAFAIGVAGPQPEPHALPGGRPPQHLQVTIGIAERRNRRPEPPREVRRLQWLSQAAMA
jgi:hypothetical protein